MRGAVLGVLAQWLVGAGVLAQSSSSLYVGGGWLSPDGEIRLVRGDRKVVTNQIDGAPALEVGFEYDSGRRWGGSLSLVTGGFEHQHRESFNEGSVLTSRNDVRYVSLLGGPILAVARSETALVVVGLQLSYNHYGGRFEITSETEPPAGGVGAPNPSRVLWDLRDDFRGGLSVEGSAWLTPRLGLTVKARRIVTDFGADIVDDPEDDGQDVDLDFDPWGLILAVRMRF